MYFYLFIYLQGRWKRKLQKEIIFLFHCQFWAKLWHFPSVLCRETAELSERGKIGHFHIYLSVRSRAVCGEKETERTGGREEEGLQPQELRGLTSLPLFSLSPNTHVCMRSNTHSSVWLHSGTTNTQRREGREESEETEEMKVCIVRTVKLNIRAEGRNQRIQVLSGSWSTVPDMSHRLRVYAVQNRWTLINSH